MPGTVVPVGIHMWDQHCVFLALVFDWGFHRQHSLIEVGAVVLDEEAVWGGWRLDAGDGREARIGDFCWNAGLSFAGGDTAVGWGSAGRSPVIKVVYHGSEESRNVERVRRVLELVVDGTVDMVGAVLCGGEEVDAGSFVVG